MPSNRQNGSLAMASSLPPGRFTSLHGNKPQGTGAGDETSSGRRGGGEVITGGLTQRPTATSPHHRVWATLSYSFYQKKQPVKDAGCATHPCQNSQLLYILLTLIQHGTNLALDSRLPPAVCLCDKD